MCSCGPSAWSTGTYYTRFIRAATVYQCAVSEAGAEEIIERVAANVILLRKRRRLTQAELSAKLGMTARYLRRIEAGGVNIGIVQLARFALALEVTPGMLLRKVRVRPERKPGHPPKRGRR